MGRDEAAAVLGVAADADSDTVRRTFRERLRRTHPDLNGASDATERTVRLTRAYQVLLQPPPPAPAPPPEPPRAAPDAGPEQGPSIVVSLVDAETIGITAPANEVVPMLIDAAHQLGDITYLDPGAGLLEVIVEFVGAPTSSVVLTLQGRATGVTEVFCTVEPLSGGEAPSDEAVTHLLWRTLRGEDPTS
jgi:hypothetical protein